MSKLRTLFVVVAVSGLCVLVTLLASLIASRRPDSEYLDTTTSSLLKANYAADGVRPRLAPLSPAIINAAAEDQARLSATQIRITPRNDTPAGSGSQATTPQGVGSTQPAGGGAVATPRPGTAGPGGLPTATLLPGQPSPTPVPNLTTAPGTSTPGPSGSESPTATPPPGSTATGTPPPGATNTPSSGPAPTATPELPSPVPATETPTPMPPPPTPTWTAIPPTPTFTPVPTATPSSSYVPLLPLPCLAPGSLVSVIETEIVFSNQSSGTIRIYWLNALGLPQFRGTVAPGEERAYDTYATHTWVVRNAADTCIAAYTLAIVPGIAVIN